MDLSDLLLSLFLTDRVKSTLAVQPASVVRSPTVPKGILTGPRSGVVGCGEGRRSLNCWETSSLSLIGEPVLQSTTRKALSICVSFWYASAAQSGSRAATRL